MEELIAGTNEAYVALAVRLAQDARYWLKIRDRIEISRPVLFDDIAPIRGLEEFLITVTSTGSLPRTS